jgi:hypothetical protein
MGENREQDNTARDYLDRLEESVGTNRDSHGLGTIPIGPFIVGRIDAINGEDSKEIMEFVPTRQELEQLAAYWFRERIERDFDWFVYQCTGSSEWRWSVFIGRRLNRLAEVLGQEAMQAVRDDATKAFRKLNPKITDGDWRIFATGSDEEQEAWRRQVLPQGDKGEKRRRDQQIDT